MTQILSSIIIPVYNKWELTRACLKSLAETLDVARHEVLVIDNASSDVTPKACAFLGERLFGRNFKFIRNEENRNFAGASNQGAEAASGQYLVFLNNDTIAEPGWHDLLMEDFASFPNLAATGPLLVYPEAGPFGRTVQHLGVIVSPFMLFGHLYQGIPEASPLAKKRRFFQAITVACMAIPRNFFFQAGKFDENFKNGFEDVDLCGRLCAMGLRFTVNPQARIIHYESQTSGRGRNEKNNFNLLVSKSRGKFRPDWESFLEADNLVIDVNEWAGLQPSIPQELEKELDARLSGMPLSEIKTLLLEHIFWKAGWLAYLDQIRDEREYVGAFNLYFKFYRNLDTALMAIKIGHKLNLVQVAREGELRYKNFDHDPEEFIRNGQKALEFCKSSGQLALARKYAAWLESHVQPRAGH